MTAEEIKKVLGLAPHPREGGWFARTYEATESVPAASFIDGRYEGARKTGTAIYYLLESDTFSEMHMLKSDEVFHLYMGDPVEMLQLLPGGVGKTTVIGTDLTAGERPQDVAERGVWQGSRLKDGGSWALLGCTVSPGFEFLDYEEGRRSELCSEWPDFKDLISKLTKD